MGLSTDALPAAQCPRGQFLRVRKHACVSREAFQTYLKTDHEALEAPGRHPRETTRAPVPPQPVTTPRRPISAASPTTAAVEPLVGGVETRAVVLKPVGAIAPTPPSASGKSSGKSTSPFGELQLR